MELSKEAGARQQKRPRESVRFVFLWRVASSQTNVQHEMSELVCHVPAGSAATSFLGIQDDNEASAGPRERIHLARLALEARYDDSGILEHARHVCDRGVEAQAPCDAAFFGRPFYLLGRLHLGLGDPPLWQL